MAPASAGFVPLEPVREGGRRIAEAEGDGIAVFLPDADDGAGICVDAGRVGQDQNVGRASIVQANQIDGFIRPPIELPESHLDELIAECPAGFDRLMQHGIAHQAAEFPSTGEAPEKLVPAHRRATIAPTVATKSTGAIMALDMGPL